MNRKRVLMEDSMTRQAFAILANENDWVLVNFVVGDKDHPPEVIYTIPEIEGAVHYVQDQVIKMDYLVIEGPDLQQLEEAVAAVVALIPEDNVRLWAVQAQSKPEKIRTAYAAGLISGNPGCSDLLKPLEWLLQDPDPDVRLAAILAVGYTGTDAIRPAIERLSRNDPHPEVRRSAAAMADAFRKESGH